jgi:four helix bundle protein
MGSAILKRDVEIASRAEKGFERKTFKGFAHFLDLAKGSCGEVRSMLYVAEDLHYITRDQATVLRDSAENLSKGIAAFQKHLRS